VPPRHPFRRHVNRADDFSLNGPARAWCVPAASPRSRSHHHVNCLQLARKNSTPHHVRCDNLRRASPSLEEHRMPVAKVAMFSSAIEGKARRLLGAR